MSFRLTCLIFLLFFPFPSFGQSSERPEGIVIPVSTLGNVSETRRQILQNTLIESLSQYYRLVPQDKFEEVQEKVFQELEYEECTEDQCIVIIQEMLQVENLFVLQVIGESQDTQLSLKWVGLDDKRVKTDVCQGCGTFDLNRRVEVLVKLLMRDIGLIIQTPDTTISTGLSEQQLKLKEEEEIRKLQEEIGLLEKDVKKIQEDRLRMETEVKTEIQRRKDEETRKREEELRILREKEEQRKQEELKRKQEELRKKQEEKERIRRVEELRRMKELLEKKREEEEKKKKEEERRKLEFEKRGYVPYYIRIRGLTGSVSSGDTKVTNTSFYGIWKNYGLGLTQMSYKTKSTTKNPATKLIKHTGNFPNTHQPTPNN